MTDMRHMNDDLGSDDLTPVDGLSDIHLEFDGMRAHSGSPNGDFTFRFVQRRDGQEKVVATMTFPVRDTHDGHPGMMARAYDQMIAVLRQGLHTAAKMRGYYRHESQTRYPRGPFRPGG
jgi:hypothetical protein